MLMSSRGVCVCACVRACTCGIGVVVLRVVEREDQTQFSHWITAAPPLGGFIK